MREVLLNNFKRKALEMGAEYFRDKFDSTKEDFLQYIEKSIERKIRKEIKKFSFALVSIFLGILGVLFLILGMIYWIVYLLGLPNFVALVSFGLILVACSIVFYLVR